MVLVNNQIYPDSYAQLMHVPWHGWTFTDLVFPSFLWIAGVAATLSTAKRIDRGADRAALVRAVFRRTVIIFALGLAVNFLFDPSFAHWRIPGVLQRIAVSYFCGTLIYLYLPPAGRVAAVGALFAVYWIGMAPGGYEIGNNFAQRVDEALLPNHLYQRANWDPEGFWGTLPSIGTFLLGAFVGDALRGRPSPVRLLAAGAAGIVAGLALDPIQPINKALWTVPFTLLTAGVATVVFTLIYRLVDLEDRPFPAQAVWTIFGMNALAVYVFHEAFAVLLQSIGVRDALYGALRGATGPANGALIHGLLHVSVSLVFAWALWRRGWFWRA